MNPFANWTKEMAEQHNARVVGRKQLPQQPSQTSNPMVRQSRKEPSKLHAEFGRILKAREPSAQVYEEAITLKLCNGVRYTPDWITISDLVWPSIIKAYEVKGYMRDDARKSLLFAAKTFPSIQFILAYKRSGLWVEQEIRP